MSSKSYETAKQFLDKKNIPYEEKDGRIVTQGNLDIVNSDLVDGKLPDLTAVEVGGNFIVEGTDLTNLVGSPRKIVGRIYIEDNASLSSLEGMAPEAGLGIFLVTNAITSLEGMASKAGGDVVILNNAALTSLKGMTQKVGGEAVIIGNDALTSLQGMTQKVGLNVMISENNALTNLEGMTQEAGDNVYVQVNKSLTSLKGITSQFKGSAFIQENPLLGSLNHDYKNVQDLKDAMHSQYSGFAAKVWEAAMLKLNPHEDINDNKYMLTARRKLLVDSIVKGDSVATEETVKQLKDIYQAVNSDEVLAYKWANDDKQVIQEAKANAMMSNMGLVQHSGGRSVG